MSENTSSWFAVVTKPRHEKTVSAGLRAKGMEEFLPQYRSRRHWSDRDKTVDLPLFPGYVFCRFGSAQSSCVRQTCGVFDIVRAAGRPAAIADVEIQAIRAAIQSGQPVQPCPHLTEGDHIRIERGPLAGVEGILLREKDGSRIVVNIGLLQRSVAVEIERDLVTPGSGAIRHG